MGWWGQYWEKYWFNDRTIVIGSPGTSRKLTTHGTGTSKRLANETDKSNELFNARSSIHSYSMFIAPACHVIAPVRIARSISCNSSCVGHCNLMPARTK